MAMRSLTWGLPTPEPAQHLLTEPWASSACLSCARSSRVSSLASPRARTPAPGRLPSLSSSPRTCSAVAAPQPNPDPQNDFPASPRTSLTAALWPGLAAGASHCLWACPACCAPCPKGAGSHRCALAARVFAALTHCTACCSKHKGKLLNIIMHLVRECGIGESLVCGDSLSYHLNISSYVKVKQMYYQLAIHLVKLKNIFTRGLVIVRQIC